MGTFDPGGGYTKTQKKKAAMKAAMKAAGGNTAWIKRPGSQAEGWNLSSCGDEIRKPRLASKPARTRIVRNSSRLARSRISNWRKKLIKAARSK
jgi:hypothetical protein